MKVSIIGGGGLVGSSAGFALQAGGIVRDICIVDVNPELADGQALDLLYGSALLYDQRITSGGTEQCSDADLICISAGLRRKPDEIGKRSLRGTGAVHGKAHRQSGFLGRLRSIIERRAFRQPDRRALA